jgi:hypothetical protein
LFLKMNKSGSRNLLKSEKVTGEVILASLMRGALKLDELARFLARRGGHKQPETIENFSPQSENFGANASATASCRSASPQDGRSPLRKSIPEINPW